MTCHLCRKSLLSACIWGWFALVLTPAAAQITFEDVGESTNSVVRVNLHGSGFFDYNGDGWDDIFVVHNSSVGSWRSFPHALLENQKNGRFIDVAEQAGVQGLLTQSAQGFAAADYDNDGYTDMVVACGSHYDRALVYHNDGDNTFSAADVGQLDGAYTYRARGVSFIDLDNNGLLDLFFISCSRLPEYPPELPLVVTYMNSGWWGFERGHAGLSNFPATPGDLYGFATADVDLDGDQDVFVPRREAASLMLINDGQGGLQDRFLDRGFPAPVYGETYFVGAVFFDYDNDGDWDLYVRRAFRPALLFGNDGNGRFTEVGASAGVNHTVQYVSDNVFGGGLSAGDFDNDGDVDLLVITRWAMELLLYSNNGDGTFTEIAESAGLREDLWDYWTAPVADYDHDGFLDVYMARSNSSDPRGGGHLYRNTSGAFSSNQWVQFHLTGVESNRSAVGSRLVLYADGKKQTRQVLGGEGYMTNSTWVHFGLGSATVVDSLIIYWPAGTIQKHTGIAPGQFISVTEGDPDLRYETLFIEGAIRHAPSGRSIPRIVLRLTGAMSASDTTDENGGYRFYPVPAGTENLALTPAKNAGEDVRDTVITAYDAALVLRALVGLDTMSAVRRRGADADRNDMLNVLDAALIGRHAVGLTDQDLSHAGEWIFAPESLSVPVITEPLTGRDFAGQVIGDVSGNWGSTSGAPKAGAGMAAAPSRIRAAASEGIVEVPLTVEANSGLLAADVWFRLEGSGVTFEGVETTELTEGYQTETNGPSDGLWKIALYGARPVNEAGVFLKLRFRCTDEGGTVVWERFALNERETALSPTVVSGMGSGRPGPSGFGLDWNYPNPFNPGTSVHYRLDRPGDAGLTVYDVRGRRVRALAAGWRPAGEYRADWDGRDESGTDAAAGVYICRLESGGRVQAIKMIKAD
ncbi:VCBS repeat-containing protein [bacterium]|nr:VCBS repeat-containing protein [bacterium]